MKTLDILKITLDADIASWQTPALRAALADHVGWEHEFMHNRRNVATVEGNPFRMGKRDAGEVWLQTEYSYDYPLFQCKTRRSNGRQQPLLLFLGPCAQQGADLFGKEGLRLRIGSKQMALPVAMRQNLTLKLCAGRFSEYLLFNYRPFNAANYAHFKSLHSDASRQAFIEGLLNTHILKFAGAVDWRIPVDVKVTILNIRRPKWISTDPAKMKSLCFDLQFRCNVFLPEYIGLGKGVSKGFGVVRRG
jgi:hypothetical protein